MQSELLPSACIVELPSKPQFGRSASEGGFSNDFMSVLPRSSGTGCLPSSQMYSSLYFVIVFGGSLNWDQIVRPLSLTSLASYSLLVFSKVRLTSRHSPNRIGAARSAFVL